TSDVRENLNAAAGRNCNLFASTAHMDRLGRRPARSAAREAEYFAGSHLRERLLSTAGTDHLSELSAVPPKSRTGGIDGVAQSSGAAGRIRYRKPEVTRGLDQSRRDCIQCSDIVRSSIL